MNVFLALLIVGLPAGRARAEDLCADHWDELEQTEGLRKLKPLFGPVKSMAMVNGTRGSYFVIDAHGEQLTLTFYTSGLFDLYPIRRAGPVQFCDDGASLRMIGLGRVERFAIDGGTVRISDGPRGEFTAGVMPEALRKLHRIDLRGLASE